MQPNTRNRAECGIRFGGVEAHIEEIQPVSLSSEGTGHAVGAHGVTGAQNRGMRGYQQVSHSASISTVISSSLRSHE